MSQAMGLPPLFLEDYSTTILGGRLQQPNTSQQHAAFADSSFALLFSVSYHLYSNTSSKIIPLHPRCLDCYQGLGPTILLDEMYLFSSLNLSSTMSSSLLIIFVTLLMTPFDRAIDWIWHSQSILVTQTLV